MGMGMGMGMGRDMGMAMGMRMGMGMCMGIGMGMAMGMWMGDGHGDVWWSGGTTTRHRWALGKQNVDPRVLLPNCHWRRCADPVCFFSQNFRTVFVRTIRIGLVACGV